MATREQRERELLELREKGLATHQTDRYKDCKYLTTFISHGWRCIAAIYYDTHSLVGGHTPTK